MLDREVAHENKLHINMRMSQSWEDLRIMMENDKVSVEHVFIYYMTFSIFYYLQKFYLSNIYIPAITT